MTNTGWGYAFVILAVLLWAGNAVVGRIAPDANVPPLALNFWRWTIALLVLAPFAIAKLPTQRHLIKSHWRLWAVFGVITVAGFNSAYYIGLQYTTVVQGTLISALLPALVLVAARIFLSQPISGRQLAGVVASIVGVAIIVLRGDLRTVRELALNIGDVWVLAAVCMWAAQTILIRFLPKEMDLVVFQVMAFVAGLAVLATFYVYETASGQAMDYSLTLGVRVGYTGYSATLI